MKPFYLSWHRCIALMLFFSAFTIYSCRKTEQTGATDNPAAAVADARSWYEKAFPLKMGTGKYQSMDMSTAGEQTSGDFSQLIKPDWNHSEVYNRSGKEVIELPLDSAIRLGFVNEATTAETLNAAKSSSKCFFIILHDAQGYQAYIMTVMADAAWLGGDFDKLKHLSYRNKGEGFSGKVLYFSPKGKLIDGYRYHNGKVNGRVSAAMPLTDDKQVQARLKAERSKKVMATDCQTEVVRVLSSVICAEASATNISCVYNYDVYIIRTCYEMSDLPVTDDDGWVPPQGGGGATTTTTVEHDSVVVVEPSTAVITDSLKAKYPCAVKLILDKLLYTQSYADFVEPFCGTQKPDLFWDAKEMPWHQPDNSGGGFIYQLGAEQESPTSRSGLSRDVNLNTKALENSSQLLITAAVIHETLHAYIGYNIAIATYNANNGYNDYGNWFAALDGFYSIKGLPYNYSGHYQMLTDYFNKATAILSSWDNNQHTSKEYAMAMLYGLNTVDPNCPADLKARLDSVYDAIKNSYNITAQDFETFKQNNLNAPSNQKLPSSGCN